MIDFGEENDAIGDKVHRLTVALFGAADLRVLRALSSSLREISPYLTSRARLGSCRRVRRVCAGHRHDARAGDRDCTQPYCGNSKGDSGDVVRRQREHVRSLCLSPCARATPSIGLLVLASEDAQRFYAEMGTMFLQPYGGLTGAALLRTLAIDPWLRGQAHGRRARRTLRLPLPRRTPLPAAMISAHCGNYGTRSSLRC